LFVVVSTTISLVGCSSNAPKKNKNDGGANVNVDLVKFGSITKTLDVSGGLQVLDKATLASKSTGRIVFLQVREGDRVTKGEVIARLDPTEMLANLRQYQETARADQVKVVQAKIQYQQSVVNSRLSVDTATAALKSANASLERTRLGQRPEATAQAHQQLIQQQANYDNAQKAYNREVVLFNGGAVAQADLDNALATRDTQKALLEYYTQAYSVAQKGGWDIDIRTAQLTVEQQTLALKNAQANLANAVINKESIVSYQAQLAAALEQVKAQKQELADLNIVSPINGLVVSRSVDPGQTVSAGTTLVEVDDLTSTYFQPLVSEVDLSSVHVGDFVDVTLDAYPGKSFKGKVAVIYPNASTTRQFQLRVNVENTGGLLRPNMYARGEITVLKHHHVIVVPSAATVRRDPTQSGVDTSTGLASGGVAILPQKVYLVGDDGKAHSQNVEIGISDPLNTEITSGLKVGDKLIITGQGQLNDGDTVQVVGAPKAAGSHHSKK
jgi:RND family efflux transporter MFP subunit